MGGWRLAQSLAVLSAEIRVLSPKQTIYSIGDAAHAATASDHNPNAAGVVCAIDVMQGNGLDLAGLAQRIVDRRHPAGKYVIHNRRIASASQGWAWRAYTGSDPHTDHIHVSVGVGPDGRSTGPYDDTSPWLSTEEEDMGWLTDPRQETLFWRVEALQNNRPTVAGGQTAGEPNRLHDALEALGERLDRVESIDYDALATALAPKLAALLPKPPTTDQIEQAAFAAAQRAEKE